MKKIIIGLLFVFISICSMSSTIYSVRTSGSNLNVNFKDGAAEEPKVEYDPYNRLLYLEFPGTSLDYKSTIPISKGRYVEGVEVSDLGSSVGVFITLAKNVSYKTRKTRSSFRVEFSLSKQYTIAVDAGHGGKDPGAHYYGYQEKDFNLTIAKYLANELKKDFNVILTRDTDDFIPLSQRPAMANSVKCDFFISVHINASGSPASTGSEVYYFSTEKASAYAEKVAAFENSFAKLGGQPDNQIKQIMGSLAYKKNQEKSVNFARPTCAAIANALGLQDKGIHGANFAVLRGFDGPGVLLELGFISNPDDLTILANDLYQRQVAKAVAEQVRKYFF